MKNIVICCDAMLRAIGKRDVVVTTEALVQKTGPVTTSFTVTIRERSGNRINNCPWCSKELPFPYEEEKDD